MAESATPARTTRPRARRAATAKAPAKPVEAVETPEETETTPEADVERYKFALKPDGETARYAKWKVPDGNGCVGNLYTPKGATRVVVLVEGPKG